MAIKKSKEKIILAKAEKNPIKKVTASVKAQAPAAKTVTKKEEKTEPYKRVQTAEGWKRAQKKKA